MTERIEESILRNLIYNETYYRKVVPFIKADYFQEYHEKVVFEEIADFASKYDKVPTKEVLTINLQNRGDLTEETFKDSVQGINSLSDDWVDYDWLLDATEKWCQDRAIYLALMQSIKIAERIDANLLNVNVKDITELSLIHI